MDLPAFGQVFLAEQRWAISFEQSTASWRLMFYEIINKKTPRLLFFSCVMSNFASESLHLDGLPLINNTVTT